MKILFLIMVMTVATFGLSACKTTADLENDRYSIDLDHDRYDGNYRHCPPGHAKKGWC